MADMETILGARLASSATGWGAIIDGVLNIRTVTETANMAAFNALYIAGFRIVSDCCRDMDCDCKQQLLAKLRPDIRIVAVTVEADNG